MSKEKRNIKVRDLQPKKDAKGGGGGQHSPLGGGSSPLGGGQHSPLGGGSSPNSGGTNPNMSTLGN